MAGGLALLAFPKSASAADPAFASVAIRRNLVSMGRVLHPLRRHRFSIEARFDWSLALVWSWPAEALAPLCGPGLELDTYEGHGFVALALVKTRRLRPKGWPEWSGSDFLLAGYRLFVRHATREGRRLRGLKILGGGADSWRMVLLGSLLTHYRYRHLRIRAEETPGRLEIEAGGGHDLHLVAETEAGAVGDPPAGSVFPDLRTARRFAGPMPFTFDYEPETHSMIRVEGRRAEWRPEAVRASLFRNSFFDEPPFAEIGPGRLANAFLVRDVAYEWSRGIVEPIGDGIDGRPDNRFAHR